MSRRYLKPIVAALVLLVTIGSFTYFVVHHPSVWHQLAAVHPATFVLLLVLYALTLVALLFVLEGTLELCATTMKRQESLLLTVYTAIINFFGPLQSGPGFRAVYLKKRHGTRLKNYALASLIYYGFFAAFSGLFLLSGLISGSWLVIIAVLGFSAAVLGLYLNIPVLHRLKQLRLQGTFKLALATLAQVSIVAVIYFIELRSVNPHINFGQAVSYTGAANFALFVSLTPGAIGFRESFLLFSRHIHHINSSNIVSASLLDRGVYVVFLGMLFLLVLAIHGKSRLQANTAAES